MSTHEIVIISSDGYEFVDIRACLLQLILFLIYVAFQKKIGTVFPKVQLKYIGENAVFQCFSHHTPKWITYGKDIPSAYPRNNSTLIIGYVTSYFAGIYKCLGTYEDGSQFEAKSKLIVGSKSYY